MDDGRALFTADEEAVHVTPQLISNQSLHLLKQNVNSYHPDVPATGKMADFLNCGMSQGVSMMSSITLLQPVQNEDLKIHYKVDYVLCCKFC